jgi:hypothetical protein
MSDTTSDTELQAMRDSLKDLSDRVRSLESAIRQLSSGAVEEDIRTRTLWRPDPKWAPLTRSTRQTD